MGVTGGTTSGLYMATFYAVTHVLGKHMPVTWIKFGDDGCYDDILARYVIPPRGAA